MGVEHNEDLPEQDDATQHNAEQTSNKKPTSVEIAGSNKRGIEDITQLNTKEFIRHFDTSEGDNLLIQFITQNDLEDQFSPLTIRSDFVVKLFKSFEGSNFNVDPNLPWNSQSPQVKKVSEARYKVITMLSEQMNTTNSNIQTQNTLSERQNVDKTEQLIMHFNIQGKRLLFIQQIKQQVKKITGPQLEEVYNDKTRLDEEGKEYTISIPSGSTEINTDLSPIQGSYWFGLELPIKKFIALAESSLEQAKKYSNQEAANLIEVTSNNISQE